MFPQLCLQCTGHQQAALRSAANIILLLTQNMCSRVVLTPQARNTGCPQTSANAPVHLKPCLRRSVSHCKVEANVENLLEQTAAK